MLFDNFNFCNVYFEKRCSIFEQVKTTVKKTAANVDEAIAVAIAAIMAKRGN